MKKNDFLDAVASAFLERHPHWELIREDRRAYKRYLGLQVPKACLLYIDFSFRPDNMNAYHGVGWSTDKAKFLNDIAHSMRLPKPRDGSLHRLRKLDKPRDFTYDDMDVSISLLHKPFDGFDLATEAAEVVQEKMLKEIEDFAFPYLCMMLKHRHQLEIAPTQLGSGVIID